MDFRERSEWYAARQVELDAGGTWEFFNGTVWGHIPYPPCNSSVLKNWRLVPPKPVLKVIDLTPLIESGLDCWFPFSGIGKLHKVTDHKHTPYWSNERASHAECQPRMSPHVHWWAGGDVCPVPEGFEIKLHFRDGDALVRSRPTAWEWRRNSNGGDIIGIEFLRVADGYTLGKEVTVED